MELPLKYLLYWLGLVEVPEFDLLFDGLDELGLSLFLLLLLVLELFSFEVVGDVGWLFSTLTVTFSSNPFAFTCMMVCPLLIAFTRPFSFTVAIPSFSDE